MKPTFKNRYARFKDFEVPVLEKNRIYIGHIFKKKNSELLSKICTIFNDKSIKSTTEQ